jgi:hypothetical protein
MLAGTGAGMVTGFRHAMLKLAALFAAALVIALMIAAAIGIFGVAIYFALAPEFGPAWGAAAAGALLVVLAGLLAVICRYVYLRQRRRSAVSPAGLASGLGGPLGAAALGASVGAGPGFDLKGVLERNAVTVLLTAFIAGMVMNNRR